MSTRRKDFSNNWCICLLCCLVWPVEQRLRAYHWTSHIRTLTATRGQMHLDEWCKSLCCFRLDSEYCIHGFECLDRRLSSLMTKFYRNNLFVMRCKLCAFLSIVKIHIAYERFDELDDDGKKTITFNSFRYNRFAVVVGCYEISFLTIPTEFCRQSLAALTPYSTLKHSIASTN